MNNLNDFKIPDDISSKENKSVKAKNSQGKIQKLHQSCIEICKKRFGENAKITQFISKLESSAPKDDVVDALSHIKKVRSASNRLNAGMTIALIIVMIFTWKFELPMLVEADQLKNDLLEQDKVISVEKMNNKSLEKWDDDKQKLKDGNKTIHDAIPDSDEKAEEVISMLENMSKASLMTIDAIGIRKVSESQMYYDDLIDVVDIYEYTFTLEGSLPNIFDFIRSLRRSKRLMDIMSMEIEENKGLYRASFLINTYYLTNNQNDVNDN